MPGSLTALPQLTGCPCGHLNEYECVRHEPLPALTSCAVYKCRNWGLEQIKRYAEELGACPCALERKTTQ